MAGPIFESSDGKQISIFLETSVRDRFKTLRKVADNGGKAVTQALQADILIAEAHSKELNDFIQAWGKDKVILDVGWIHRCIQAQRFIGENESWGGYDLRAFESGGEAEEEQREYDDQEEEQPYETSQFRRQTNGAGDLPPSSSQPPHYQKSQSPKIKISDSPPPIKKRRLGEPSSTRTPEAPYDPNAVQTFQQTPSQPPPPSTPSLTQDISALLTSPNIAPLIEALHHIRSQGVGTDLETLLRNIGSTSTPNLSTQQQRQTPQSDAINSFTSRSDSTAPNTASPNYEYGEESTATAQNHHRRVSSRSSLPSLDDETRRASGSGLGSKRKHVNAEKAPAVQTNEGFFFLDGAPSDFYIDMSVKNRKELINIVKKNGGKIVSVMSEADYVVLDDRSPSFSKTALTVSSDKTAVQPKWLLECEQESDLVPVEPYLIKTTRSASSSPSKSKERRQKIPSSSQKTPVSSQKLKSKPSTPSTSKLASPSKFKPLSHRLRSPSPPAHIEALSDTKYAFTQAEKEWFVQYIRFQWQRDPKLSVNALLNAITRKAPHHPKSSWNNAFRIKWAQEVEAIRNELNIF